MVPNFSRRQFLLAGGIAAAAAATPSIVVASDRRRRWLKWANHPEPRKDYTADKVLTAEKLNDNEELIELFDGAREFHHILDGIRCQCGCASDPDMYSLLSCYEGDNAMAKWCPICQGEGRMSVRLARAGKNLEEIRKAIDVRY
jgi:hypothetical protein